jgi:hypothetical protein
LANEFTFNVITSQALLAQTSHNEWVVNSDCTHDMAKDASMFSSLDIATKKIYVADDIALDIVGHGDVTCLCGQIFKVFHAPSVVPTTTPPLI